MLAERPGLLPTREAYEVLEPYDGKLSRTVLRGLGGRNAPRLPGVQPEMMKKITLTFVLSFLGVSLYDILLNGWFEPPSLNVAHFVAGAGGITLIIRFVLCILAVGALGAWSIARQTPLRRLSKLALAVTLPAMFYYTVYGIQRFAKEFREDTFGKIVSSFHDKEHIDARTVMSALGEPLVKETQTIIEVHRDQVGWLYSYMPSSGFGWNKRVLYFDKGGRLVDYNRMDEP